MNINQNLIALIQKFNSKDLEFFLRDKSDSFEFPREKLYFDRDKYQTYENAELLATNQLSDGTIIVCTILVTKDLTERSSKKLQFDFAKDILKNNYYDAGIFVFYDADGHFRFSLIYAEYYGNKRSWNSFKRFTYYVSKELTNKTFSDQISNADFSSIEALKKAFSVEPVTKQFYNEIQSWYFWAMDKISFPTDYKYSDNPAKDDEIRNSNNLIRLITRIIFIWFIKQKNLINEDIFSEEKLKNIIKDFNKNKDSANYYNAILQNLFFATLNQKINEREFAENNGFNVNKKQYGVKNLYRYDDLFLITKDEVKKLFIETPFLNGGLFDCLDKEDENGKVIYIDGFSRNPNKRAIIPDYLFFQNEEKKVDLSKYGLRKDSLVRGLINILQSYNFTIDENTLIDQEVALDPELLGKVFENLLASYNPETASTARKATGSYYTPREIVDYMVQESLFYYLKSKCPDIDEAQIRNLLSYADNTLSLNDDERNNIIKALDDIKILDPACGSGAFPMGALHMIVNALQKLDPDNKAWKNLQMAKVTEETKKIFKENDKNEREVRLNELNNTFDESINYPDYARKLFLIENCIYGVDIQTIAIQISKLRFFISLVIDQRVDKTRDNLGIRALPNMETRFVAANTLIELEKPDNLFYTDDIQDLEKELKQLRHKYFSAKTREEKLQYQQKDKELRDKLSNALKQIGYKTESSEKIAKFDIYDPNASADWFDPEWMFGVNDGFDIIIGNPPYGAKLTKEQQKYFNEIYNIGSTNTAMLFIKKALELLNGSGKLGFIVPKSICYASNWRNIREILLQNLVILVDCRKAWQEVELEQVVFILDKSKKTNTYTSGYFENGIFKKLGNINKNDAKEFGLLLNGVSDHEVLIAKKIKNKSIFLNDISTNQRGAILQKYITDAGDYEAIGGSQIQKYGIIGIKNKINKKKIIYENAFIKSNAILVQNIINYVSKLDCIRITACIPDNDNYIILDTINQIILKNDINRNIIWYLLNSKLINWYAYCFILGRATFTMHFDNPVTARIPIPKDITKLQDKLAKSIDYYLALIKEFYNTPAHTNKWYELKKNIEKLEKTINNEFYKYYDLTEDEIKIVEGNS